MDALQRDAYTMQPTAVRADSSTAWLKLKTPDLETIWLFPNRGDIVINRADGQRFCIGNIYRQEDMADAYARRHDGNYSRDIPRQPIVDPRYQPEPYYGRQDPRYRYPDVATPPFLP
jgi:hypothetical protein